MAFGKPSTAPFTLAFAWLVGLTAVGCQDGSIPLTPDQVTGAVARPVVEPCSDPANRAELIRDFVEAVNAERRKAGVGMLKRNPTLMAVADYYACRMIDGGFFDHVDPEEGSTVDYRAVAFGYAFAKIGENLAAGQTTVEEAVLNWMQSPKHRENLLDPTFTEIGVGVKDGGEYGRYWVQELGRPLVDGTESRPPPATSQQSPPGESASSKPAESPNH